MSEIYKVDELMKEDKKKEASILLDKLLQERPLKSETCGDAVNIYLYGKMYKEAIDVIKLYKSVTGKNLNTDLSLEDIEKEQREYEASLKQLDSSKIKVFKRLSLRQRGHFSNHPTFSPVKERVYMSKAKKRSDVLTSKIAG